MSTLIVVGLVLVLLAFLTWWLAFETEGVYLGRRVVIWLYDVYARRYDHIKEFVPEYDHVLLAKPIMARIAPHQSPMVLDVATGTGRLPDTLLNHVAFQGRIVSVDLSRGMLAQAAPKFEEDGDQVILLQAPAELLPFEDDSFDVVTCLEALEFVSNRDAVLNEMARVLRPGGTLLLTNRFNTRWMPGKLFSDDALTAELEARGFVDVVIEPWQEEYKRVWACKAGEGPVVGARSVVEVLASGVGLQQGADGVYTLRQEATQSTLQH